MTKDHLWPRRPWSNGLAAFGMLASPLVSYGVFSQYACKIGHSIDEEVVEEDSIKFSVTRGAPPSMAALEESLNEVKSQ